MNGWRGPGPYGTLKLHYRKQMARIRLCAQPGREWFESSDGSYAAWRISQG